MRDETLREIRDRSVDPAPPRSDDLERAIDIVSGAAAAIEEMLRYNRTMKAVAGQGVSHYRAEAERLAERLAQLLAERQKMIDDYELRIKELEVRIAQQEREIESMRSLLWPGGRQAR